MKTLGLVGLLGLLAIPAWAQPYPTNGTPQPADPYAYPQGTYQPPAGQYPQQGYSQQYGQQGYPQQYGDQGYPQQVDPSQDPDGYDVDYDIRYDDAAAQQYDDGYDPNAYQQFEGDLAPYGSWVDDPAYGRIWMPSSDIVGDDFYPYASGGHFVLTEYGWTWVSDWDWGWAPFHYGRWVMCGGGWGWVPGSVWGPAWVSWRSGGGYVGWAPMPPRGVTIGPPTGVRSPWHFVVASQLGSARPVFLPAHTVSTVFARTSVVSNARSVSLGGASVRVNAGPTALIAGAGVGVSTPVRLASVAPRALPHPSIAPRAGVALPSRPWVQAGVTRQVSPSARPVSIPIGVERSAPVYRGATPMPRPNYNPGYRAPSAPHSYAPSYPTGARPAYNYSAARPATAYRPTYSAPAYHPSYAQPAYRSSYAQPAYRSSYAQPAYRSSYAQPAYHAAPTYAAPAYRAAPTYAAPAYHAAPSYAAPAYHPTYSAPVTHSSGASFSGGRHR